MQKQKNNTIQEKNNYKRIVLLFLILMNLNYLYSQESVFYKPVFLNLGVDFDENPDKEIYKKNKVKTINIYGIRNKDTVLVEKKQINRNGLITYQHANRSNIKTLEYDTNNNLIESVYRMPYDKDFSRGTYEYNGKNLLIKSTVFEYKYDDSKSKYDTLVRYTYYDYDNKGRIIKEYSDSVIYNEVVYDENTIKITEYGRTSIRKYKNNKLYKTYLSNDTNRITTYRYGYFNNAHSKFYKRTFIRDGEVKTEQFFHYDEGKLRFICTYRYEDEVYNSIYYEYIGDLISKKYSTDLSAEIIYKYEYWK